MGTDIVSTEGTARRRDRIEHRRCRRRPGRRTSSPTVVRDGLARRRGAAGQRAVRRRRLPHRGRAAPREGRRQAIPSAVHDPDRAARTRRRPIRRSSPRRPSSNSFTSRRSITTTSWTRRRCGAAHPARTRAGATASRSSPATICSRTRRGWCRRSDPTPCGSSPRRSPNWSPARCARRSAPSEEQDPVEHYLKVVWEKTGSLIAACGRFGGTFSGGDAEHVERLERLGDAVGTAFQISDDIIDISSVVRAVRQDSRHRPARGRPHPARAVRAARRGSRRATACGSCSPARSPTTPWSRRRSNCSSGRPAWSRPRRQLGDVCRRGARRTRRAAAGPGQRRARAPGATTRSNASAEPRPNLRPGGNRDALSVR